MWFSLPPIIYVGWVFFLLSMFLPAIKVNLGWGLAKSLEMNGIQATYLSLAFLGEFYKNFEYAYFAMLSSANIVFLVGLIFLPLLKRGQTYLYACFIVSFTIVIASQILYFRGLNGELYIGYYVWLLGFLLVSIGALKLRHQPSAKLSPP